MKRSEKIEGEEMLQALINNIFYEEESFRGFERQQHQQQQQQQQQSPALTGSGDSPAPSNAAFVSQRRLRSAKVFHLMF